MDLAVVVQSCDKYEFVWERWSKCFQGAFVPKDIPVCFLSELRVNEYLKPNSNFVNLRVVPDDWSNRLIEALTVLIPHKFIFYMQEDMFPRALLFKWHLELFHSILNEMMFDALQVSPNSKHYTLEDCFPSHPIKIKTFANESNYLVSHQPRLWKKEFLLSCLEKGESPWTNEIEGTKRIRKRKPSIGFIEWNWYEHMIKKGKWIK